MSVELNHTIVWCRDREKSATFLTEILDLPRAAASGPMLVVELSNGVSLDYYDNDGPISSQHYALMTSEDEFARVFARIRSRANTRSERRGK